MIEVAEVGYSTPKQIQDIIINDAANSSETETYSIDKIKDLIENSTPENLPLPIFTNNTTALAGGLLVNDFYRLPISNDISLVAVVISVPNIPNFKIKANWFDFGVVNQETFVSFYTPQFSNMFVSDFTLSGDLLECYLTASLHQEGRFNLMVRVFEFYGVGSILNMIIVNVYTNVSNEPLFMPYIPFLRTPLRIETSIWTVSHLQNFLDFANSMPTIPFRGELYTGWGSGNWDVNIRNAIIAKGWLLPWL